MSDATDWQLRIDHVGIAVTTLESADDFVRQFGAEKLIDRESESGAFRWTYYRFADASRLELLAPVGDEASFIREFLDRNGPGVHHVTLEVTDLDAMVAALEQFGVDVVDRTAHEGYAEAFVSPRNPTGTLFQLVEYRSDRPDADIPPEDRFIGGQQL